MVCVYMKKCVLSKCTHATATFIPDWKQAQVLVEVDVHFLMMWHVHVPVYKSQHAVCVCVHEKMRSDSWCFAALGSIKAV